MKLIPQWFRKGNTSINPPELPQGGGPQDTYGGQIIHPPGSGMSPPATGAPHPIAPPGGDPDMHPLPIGPKDPQAGYEPPIGPNGHLGQLGGPVPLSPVRPGGTGLTPTGQQPTPLNTYQAYSSKPTGAPIAPPPGYTNGVPVAAEDQNDLGQGASEGVLSGGGMTDPFAKKHSWESHPKSENPLGSLGGDPREGAGKV